MITVLFFGATAELTGTRIFQFHEGTNVAIEDLVKRLNEKFPRLAGHKLLASINRSYANGSSTVVTGDEVAIFTAVSGG